MLIEPRVIFPHALWLLVLVPVAVYAGLHMRSLARSRKITVIGLRVTILLCLILAFAGLEVTRKNGDLAVFFLLDQSNSIPEQVRLAAADAVQQSARLYMEDDDKAGVIVFGEDASIETAMRNGLELSAIQSTAGGEQSDLAAAIRLALAAFPQGYMKRVVIYSDGNETRGAALEEVKLAQAAGVQVDVVPLTIEGGNDIRVQTVSSPNTVDAGEPFHVEVVIRADHDTDAVLRVSQRSAEGSRPLPEQRVTLRRGDNVFILPQEISGAGFYEYEVTVDAEDDTVLANNEGRGFAIVHGEPRVLYVEADPQHSTYLGPALQVAGLDVTTMSPATMPASLASYQSFDAVVMSGVGGTDLATDQMRAVEATVRDLGIGLVMVGGPKAYGAGGLQDTPVERALPLNMDIKQRKVLPRAALVLVIDKSGSMEGEKLHMAKYAAIEAVKLLSNLDYIGVVCFDSGAYWLVDTQLASDKQQLLRDISTLGIGGGTNMYPALEQAYLALSRVDASVKHCIVLTDGKSESGEFSNLASYMANQAMTVSAVAVGNDADQALLADIARWGGGRYYFTDTPQNIPQIFTKEATLIKRKPLLEERFIPRPKQESELLRGFDVAALPALNGYVVTTPKESATIALASHEDDPVLAHWRYGLGKSVAFTSDVTTRWAADWMDWEGFDPFWSKNVRWAMRDMARSGFQVETALEDGKAHIRLDAVDADGGFINGLRPMAVITAPDYSRMETAFLQTGPGIYESTFSAEDRGTYMVNVLYGDAESGQHMIPAGLAVNYSREYEHNSTNRGLLEQLALLGGGSILSPLDNPFINNLPSAPQITPVWQWLVLFALSLFPIDILLRRVIFDFGLVLTPATSLLRTIPGLKRVAPVKRRSPKRQTGHYGTLSAQSLSLNPGAEPGAAGFAAATSPAPADRPLASKADQKPGGNTDYTRQLLAAKERALKKKQGRSDDKPGGSS